MDNLESAGTRALLLDARNTSRLAHHAVLSSEDDVLVRESLLELCVRVSQSALPHPSGTALQARTHLASNATLNLVPSLELRHGNEDDHSLLATLDVHLPRRRDLKRAQVGLELASLEVEQGLSDSLLHLVGGRAGRVGGAKDLGLEGRLCEVQAD